MWEDQLVKQMEDAMRTYPHMELLDLGCNIGVFTIYAAKLGRRVVGVDANKNNLALLDRALGLNKLQGNVNLIWNAISDVYESVVLKDVPGNNGGSFIQKVNVYDISTQGEIQTITLDDIAPLFVNSTLFIKMDIEGSEYKALKQSSILFKSADVRFVMMEMMWTRKKPDGRAICAIMSGFGFKPFHISLAKTQHVLNVDYLAHWPDNVIWTKPTKIVDHGNKVNSLLAK